MSARRPLATSVLLLLAGLASPPVRAADPGRLSDVRRGEGQISRGPESEKLDEATVELRQGGYAEIVVRSFRGTYSFVGSWRPAGGNQVSFTINEAYGERGADAAGWISISGGTFERIEIDGRNASGGKIAVSFRGTGPGRPPQPEWSGLDSTRGGAGEFEYGRSRETLDRVTVQMGRDGTGEIRFRSRGPVRLTGNWSELKPDSVRFDVAGGLDGSTSGTGTVWFRRGEVERVEVDGRAADGRFQLQFRAGATPPPPPPHGGGGGRFTEEFGYDQPGADLRDFRADDLRSCQDACDRDSRCRAYTFNSRDLRCYLKSEERPMLRRSDCTTGVKRGGGGGNGFSQRDGYNLEGGDYTSVFQRGLDECVDACRRDRECRAFTYNTRDRMCYLKDRVGDYSPRRDTVSGEKTR